MPLSTVVSLVMLQVVLPALFIAWLARARPTGRSLWLVQALGVGAYLAFGLAVGNAAWTSVYLSGALLIGYVAALVVSFRRTPALWWPIRPGKGLGPIVFIGTHLLLALLFVPLCVLAFRGYAAPENPVPLVFPLRNGVYHVGQGGNHPLINYHNVSTTQRYALDVTRLNALGLRAAGLYPERLDRYAIFGDTLYSPCSGVVDTARTDLPDLTPPDRDREHPPGNHVVLNCDGVTVYLAHLMQGSVRVATGDSVAAGTPMGRVGNSGNTTEPHLHLHAERNGAGVPVTFGGRFLVRNSLVWSR